MREGTQGRQGLQDMAERIRERRRQLEQSGRMDGLLEDLRDLLDTALEAERAALFPDPSDDARFREALLDNVPDDIGRAVRELSSYDWRSDEARAAFDQIRERLQRDVVDQQFRDLTHGIDSMSSPESRQALKEMMADLNQLLEKHQRGEDVTDDYRDFIDKHRDFFPDAPETIEEFIDELARRSAAMQRMLDSMSPEQRAELQSAMEQALEDLDLQSEMAALQQNLRNLRPEFGGGGRASMDGERRMGLPEATDALAELADLEGLADALGDGFARADLDDIDEEAVERALGRQARDDLEALRTLQRELERQGYLVSGSDGLELTPKAIRRIGTIRPARRLRLPRRQHPRHARDPAVGRRGRAHRHDARLGLRRRAARRRRPHPAQRGVTTHHLGGRRDTSLRRRLRGARDRDDDPGRRRPAHRPVLLDGGQRHLARGEDDGAGPAHARVHRLPARRTGDHLLRERGPGRPSARAAEPRGQLHPGHEPAARTAARRPVPRPPPRLPAHRHGRHRRRADRAPAARAARAGSPGRRRRRRSARQWRRSTA